jgi:Lrp/AsnC family leucine-responsive transcriptional regulator
MVGLSLPSVSDRLKKLEEGGWIREYRAILDPKRAGYDITAFIFVSVDSSKHYGQFIEHAHATDGILECHAITGEGTHLLKVRTANTSALEKLLAKIQSWSGVLGTRSSVVLSTSKEDTRLKIHNSK